MSLAPILVTGAAGCSQGSTGFHVTRSLRDKGRPVRAFVHRLDERSDRLRALGAEIVEGDLRDFRLRWWIASCRCTNAITAAATREHRQQHEAGDRGAA